MGGTGTRMGRCGVFRSRFSPLIASLGHFVVCGLRVVVGKQGYHSKGTRSGG